MGYDSVWVPAVVGKLSANPGLCRTPAARHNNP
jgi:hypothetical protein